MLIKNSSFSLSLSKYIPSMYSYHYIGMCQILFYILILTIFHCYHRILFPLTTIQICHPSIFHVLILTQPVRHSANPNGKCRRVPVDWCSPVFGSAPEFSSKKGVQLPSHQIQWEHVRIIVVFAVGRAQRYPFDGVQADFRRAEQVIVPFY